MVDAKDVCLRTLISHNKPKNQFYNHRLKGSMSQDVSVSEESPKKEKKKKKGLRTPSFLKKKKEKKKSVEAHCHKQKLIINNKMNKYKLNSQDRSKFGFKTKDEIPSTDEAQTNAGR
ncbi:hypothetical protein EAI_07918 [Harpegnathos saltator]|uniref:Uncharacterized protein n=1 Tax=Harpegnathos saltator TaxID=610380 RepID=E2BEE8_HARSA|nr:hypothetical protein EAI_07918 [Harpegnathos saltator]